MDLKQLIEEKCLISGSTYKISDGSYVDTYVDMYKVLLGSDLTFVRNEVVDEIYRIDWSGVNFLAGRETCGSLLIQSMNHWDRLLVRKNSYEIASASGKKGSCILIDDVTSVGLSMEDSVNKLRYAGYTVKGALSIVYRGKGAEQVAERLGIPFKWMVYIPE